MLAAAIGTGGDPVTLAIVSKNNILCGLLDARCEQDGLSPVLEFQSIEDIPADMDLNMLLVHVTEHDPRLLSGVNESSMNRPKTRLVLFGPDELINEIARTVSSGVAACVSESRPVDDLLTVLKGVFAGFRIMPMELAETTKSTSCARSVPEGPEAPNEGMEQAPILSVREVAILELLRDGLSNKDIANRLGIVESTVKVHLRSCYSKLRAKNRTQAALWAAHNLGSRAHEAH